jgi:hypothetical protein
VVVEGLLQLLADLGILCHPGKCELEPVNDIEFLGMKLAIPDQQFHLTNKQKRQLQTKVDDILSETKKQARAVNRKNLAKLTGYL